MTDDRWLERDRLRLSCHPGDLGRYPNRLTHEEKAVSQWLWTLDKNSFEGLWFLKFSKHFSCELEAGFVYLGLDNGSKRV